MTDTFVAGLYDVKKNYPDVYNQLLKIDDGFRKYDVINPNRFDVGGTLHHEVLMYDSSKRVNRKAREKFVWKVREQPSSHYKVIFQYDTKADRLVFNFSLPKYFYAQNITQNIVNCNETNFHYSDNDFLSHLEKSYDRFVYFVRSFLRNEFPGIKISFTDLEVKRLDFCFNQVFENKKDALDYLEEQRRIPKSGEREFSGKGNYETALFIPKKGYSVKIYHKGTEFAKDDAKELLQINKMYERNIFNVARLQQFADNILRYEITIRPEYISYLYNSKVFRKKSSSFKKMKSLYNAIKSYQARKPILEYDEGIEKIHKRFADVYVNGHQKPITEFLYYQSKKKFLEKPLSEQMIVKLYRDFYYKFDSLLNHRRRFFMKLGEEKLSKLSASNASNVDVFATPKEVEFNKEIFYHMGKCLWKFMNDMKVEQKSSTKQYLEKIDEYNAQRQVVKAFRKNVVDSGTKVSKRMMDKNKIGMILTALENYSLKELRKELGFSKSTYYYYKAQLKKIGYTKNTVFNGVPIKTSLDYRAYYTETSYNRDTYFINNLGRVINN